MNLDNLTKKIKEPGFWQDLWIEAQLVWRLLADPDVSTHLKVIPVGVVLAYFAFPLDLIPDFALFFGQLDDLGVMLLGAKIFVELCPTERVLYHRANLKAGNDDEIKEKITIDN